MDFREQLSSLLVHNGVADASTLLEVPPNPQLGDYALPCFMLAKERKKSPVIVAQELAAAISAPFLVESRAVGPYVNFFIKKDLFAKEVIQAVLSQKTIYGTQEKKSDKVMIEYSQPNTHKAFHVGHLRGTSIGESLARILRHAGYDVIQANYSGDTGAHIAKWLWYYTTHDRTEPPTDPHEREAWIARMYVNAVKALADQPEREEEVGKILLELDARTPGELNDIYLKTRQWSIDAFNTIYSDLHAHFDHWFFESEVEERGKVISHDLVARGIAKEDDDAIIVDLESKNLGVWVLLRKDGTALYSAKDLALAEVKFNTYHIDRSLYIIGAAQGLHMQQLFETLRQMGFPQTEKCYHLSMNEVRLPTGKMSSRTGQNILYSDMREEVAEHATREVLERHPDWEPARVKIVVDKVITAALKFDMLAIDPNKSLIFDTKRATEFEGETGPYLQYTYARANSIIAKTGGVVTLGTGALLTHEKETELLRQLSLFPSIVARAADEYAPSHVAHHCTSLAKAFNSFYHDCPVLSAEGELKNDRLALVHATIAVLRSGLDLLAIDALEEM